MIAAPLTYSRTVSLRDVLSLTKPRITLLVLLTTAGGLFLAPVHPVWTRMCAIVLATAAVVSAANTLNCYLERDIDGLMARTRKRPLPAGRLDARIALMMGIFLSILSVPVLAYSGGPVAGLLAALALFSYVCVYTPMKQW